MVVGSLALAAVSLDFRREVAIVAQQTAVVEAAIDLFNPSAGSGRRPWPDILADRRPGAMVI